MSGKKQCCLIDYVFNLWQLFNKPAGWFKSVDMATNVSLEELQKYLV